jgi:2-methylcitrate dehydratase PrpD
MEPVCRYLAEWCASAKLVDIPDDVRRLVPARILDTAGLVIAAGATEAVRAARSVAQKLGGIAEATVIGLEPRVPASSAALVHGVAAHAFDFDDTFPDSVVHAGSVVIPTALAMAEALSATAEEFLASIVIGYEVAARIGGVAGRRFHARNMHATGFVGPLAAAAVASRLKRLSGEQTSWAIGLAASMSSGTRAYAKDGGWSKWLHIGWAAHGGIIAAELAGSGFRGPEYVLNGGSDLYSVMLRGDQVDRDILLADLGKEWRSRSAEFKYYPCAHVIHPFIDAVLAIVSRESIAGADIEKVECTIAPWAAAIVCEPVDAKLKFNTELEAIGSLPYQLAAAVLDGKIGLTTLSPQSRQRDDIAEFAPRIVHRKDDTLGRGFDGNVTIYAKDGRSFSRQAALPGNDANKVREKFIDLAGPVVGHQRATDSAKRILNAPGDWTSAVELFRAFDSTPLDKSFGHHVSHGFASRANTTASSAH